MTQQTDIPNPIDAMIRTTLQRARSRPLRSLRKWIEDEVYIADGPFEGFRYAWDRQPVHRLIVDEIDSGNWSEMFFTGPSQSGKTLIAFCYPMLYHLTETGESLVMGVPEARMADDKYKIDLLPPMKASPNLEKLIPVQGPGSQGGVVRDTITFRNDSKLKIMTRSGSDQSKAGFTSRVVVVTEAAGFSKTSEASREANPLKQLQARQRAYDASDRRLYVEGTVTIEEDLPWSAQSDSSRSRIVSQCPWCAEWVLPEREHLRGYADAKSSGEAGRLAYWVCPDCEGEIDDAMRRKMVAKSKIVHGDQEVDRDGNVAGELPDTNRLFIRYTAWHNMFVSTQTLGQEEWRAAQIDEEDPDWEDSEKERCQFVWVTPYKPKLIERAPLQLDRIIKRRDKVFSRGRVPDDTTHLTCGVDIGMHLAWYVVLAGRANGSTHYVDYGPLDVPSRDFDVDVAIYKTLADLAATLEAGYQFQQSVLSPSQVWIDAGYEANAVFEFCRMAGKKAKRSRRKYKYIPVFGRGTGQLMTIYQAPTKKQRGIVEMGRNWHMSLHNAQKCMQIFTNSDFWKGQIHHAFYLDDDKPGASTLFQAPQVQHKQLARHIINEQRSIEFVPGKGEVVKWEKKGANHLLDAAQYARAALERAGFRAAKT